MAWICSICNKKISNSARFGPTAKVKEYSEDAVKCKISAPNWASGTLKLKASFDIKGLKSGKIDEFALAMRSTYRIKDGILGKTVVKSRAVKI